jgi:hypothetical protein
MTKRKSTKDKQRSTKHTHKAKDRSSNTNLTINLQTVLQRKLKIEQHEPHYKPANGSTEKTKDWVEPFVGL